MASLKSTFRYINQDSNINCSASRRTTYLTCVLFRCVRANHVVCDVVAIVIELSTPGVAYVVHCYFLQNSGSTSLWWSKKKVGLQKFSYSPLPSLFLFRPVPFLANFTKRVSYKELFELLPVKYLRSKDLKLNDPLQIQTHPITTNTSSACFFTCGKLLIQWIMLFYSPYYTIIV